MFIKDMDFTLLKIITIFMFVVPIMSLSYFYVIIRNRMKKVHIAINSIVTFFSLFELVMTFSCYTILRDGKTPHHLEIVWMYVPTAILIAMFVFNVFCVVHISVIIAKYNKVTVTPSAITEGMNSINAGVCIFQKNGTPRLVNKYIDNFSFQLTGKYLHDGNRFIEEARSGKRAQVISDSMDKITIRLHGYFYDIVINNSIINSLEYIRIGVNDVTQEYKLLDELKDENERRKNYQERLKTYSNELESYTIEEEILKTKMSVHNDFGQILLVGRHSMDNKDNRDDFINRFEKISSLVFEEKTSDFDELMDMAESLDIKLNINTRIRENHNEMVIKLLYEVLTNTIKHTSSKNIILTSENNGRYIIYKCHNDELNQDTEFKEGGGLSSFRKFAERNGCNVEYEEKPYFAIKLKISK